MNEPTDGWMAGLRALGSMGVKWMKDATHFSDSADAPATTAANDVVANDDDKQQYKRRLPASQPKKWYHLFAKKKKLKLCELNEIGL